MIKDKKILLNSYVTQVKGNIVSDMGGEKVMLSIKSAKYYNLGEIGGDIWELLKDKIQVDQLVTELLAMYDVDRSTCEEHVISFLQPLLEEDLIEISEQ